ncbi:MAG TPA: PQQ-binding-like beta-propeller repeat protein [Ktedonobacterales bacterium]|nr:PQQ-binding-like beta-propeller repeat protein [Ktedonobacterales bacterium]
MNDTKKSEPNQQALTDINIPGAPDDLLSAHVSAGGAPPRGNDGTSFLRSALAVAVVGLVLAGFLAVMLMCQSGGQDGVGPLASTSVKGDGGIVLAGSQGYVTALRACDGAMIWRLALANATGVTASGNMVSNLQVADGVAYITVEGGSLFAVRVSDGSQLWRKDFGIGLTPTL